MLTRRRGLRGVFCSLALLSTACAARTPVVATQTPVAVVVPQAEPAPIPELQPDPVDVLIAASEAHFSTGQRELQEGHLEAARTAFDAAVQVLLDSPGGARTTPRLGDHLDRLVERISGLELTALAQADGFAENAAEPASIDQLLAISTFEALVPTTETTQIVAQDLQVVVHDIDIPQNPRVLSYVQLFSGRLKGYLEEGLNRGARYLPMIQEVFRSEGLPLDLAYIPLIESAFKPTALSRAKAKGIWQFMRGTALENGLSHDWYIDERADPEKATRAAAKYLKTLHAMFGDWHLALASYNGGPGRVQRAMKRSGRKDFWKLSSSKAFLPRETRDYVPLVLAAIIIARNPAQYGMTIWPAVAPPVETVTVAGAVDLRRVAEWAGAPVQEIQELNPELRRWTTPVRATDYDLKVPAGTAEIISARLDELSEEELAPLNHYIVKKGDTLLAIAKRLKVSRADLAEANYLSIRAKLQTGQQLIIPRAPALQTATHESPAPVETSDVVLARQEIDPAIDGAPVPADTTHRVRRGDTLFSIAKRYGTTVARLKEWNGLRSNVIQVGQRLVVQAVAAVATH